MTNNYDGPATLVDNDGSTAALTVRLWRGNPNDAAREPGRWGGDIERIDGQPLPRPIFSSGSENFLLRLPDGSEGRFRIDYHYVSNPAAVGVEGVGPPPF
jgi:hypothetical protein